MRLVLLAAGLAAVGIAAGAYNFAMRPVTLRIAVGPQNSDDVKVIQALTQAFAAEKKYVRLRPVLTDGAQPSGAMIAEGKADLAVVRGDLYVPKNVQAVATLRKNVVVMWVPPVKGKAVQTANAAKATKVAKGVKAVKAEREGKDEKDNKAGDITKITQLAGKKVGVIGRTEAYANLLKVILQQYGVDPAKVEIVQFSANEVADAVKDNRIDAFLAAGPVNSKVTTEAIAASSRDGAPTFLAIDSAEAIAQNYPVYEAAEIPAGAFGGSPHRPDDEVKTISFNHHIVARNSLSEVTVAAFTRQLFAIRQRLMTDFPLAAKIETPDTDKDAVLPAHPGAAAYVDGEEKSFMDRYSDYIWWVLMGASALGSAGAWFAGYFRKEERSNNSSLRERLLDMIAAARRSDNVEELDKMQTEADDILRDTLTCFEDGAIEEGTLTAFNIALEQFHNAVADRKAVLADTPPPSPVRSPRPQVV